MGPADLHEIMSGLMGSAHRDPNLLVGYETSDDAAVYRMADGTALVLTLDLITPIVDDPSTFGRIAAANSLSDVYAMGGRPLTCLNICCFPKDGIPRSALREILEGAAETVKEAGALIVGGHTVIDPELKFGLSVMGTVDPSRILRNGGARPGQALVLTKPIGLGLVMNAAKKGLAPAAVVENAVEAMTTLNGEAAEAALRRGASGATDITGFGFSGHAFAMARASGVELRIRSGTLPVLEGAVELHLSGVAVSQCDSNRSSVGEGMVVEAARGEEWLDLLHDPQTSGGLLVSLPAAEAEPLVDELRRGRSPFAAVIGDVVASDRPRIRLVD